MIFILESKTGGKTELRAIDEREIREVVMRSKAIVNENKRRWDLIFKDGSEFSLKDDDEYLDTKSSPAFNDLLRVMAKIFRV